MLSVGIVGAGGIAAMHARHWRADGRARIAAIADADPARARRFAEAHAPGALVVPDLDALLAQPVTAVDICTPPWLHAPQARAVLAAGRHAILEKPLAPTAAALDGLIAAEAAAGRVAVPVLQNRLGLGPRQLRAVQRAGLCGAFRHALIETSWRRTADYYAVPWRGRLATELGGCLTGLAIHQLDVVLGFAPPLRAAQAHLATLAHRIEVEDCAGALLTCDGGGFISLLCSVHAHRETSRIRMVFADIEVEAGEAPYAWAAQPWRFTADDAAHQARLDEVLSQVQDEPVAAGADPLWTAAARVWIDRCLGAPPLDPASGARTDLASARPGLAVLDLIHASAGRAAAAASA